ncbi:MAG TPA: ABC transporter permease [Candidatus Saccharimonadales bacterium]|nr:ABC transporter permease [Candidatus Saccharimonadales bacterium]
MKSYTKGYIKMAITAVRANRWRSFLTMLGVIIGVASVIVVVSISVGVKHQVSGQINKLGKDVITVRSVPVDSGTSSSSLSSFTSLTVLSPLPADDYGTVAGARGVAEAVPLSIIDGTSKGDMTANIPVVGTSDNLASILNQTVAYGVFFGTDDSQNNVAVLGPAAAQRLFNESVPLGRSFTFRGQQFVVRGVFDSFATTPLSGEIDFNNAIFIPYDVAQNLANKNAPLYEILAKPSNSHQVNQTVAAINSRLLKSHGGTHDFSVLKSSQSLSVSNNILDLLTKLIAGVAAVSLLVGGVGIMNVMLVSVTERMHEVGIRKALGATNRQILGQFMVEATVLSLIGGLLGIVASVIIDILIILTTNLHPVLTWPAVVLASGVSIVIGILFGSVPALKAARKEPIDALRSE